MNLLFQKFLVAFSFINRFHFSLRFDHRGSVEIAHHVSKSVIVLYAISARWLISLAPRVMWPESLFIASPSSIVRLCCGLLKIWNVQELSLGAKKALKGDPNCLKQTQENYFQRGQLFFMFKGKGERAGGSFCWPEYFSWSRDTQSLIDLTSSNVWKIRQTDTRTDGQDERMD